MITPKKLHEIAAVIKNRHLFVLKIFHNAADIITENISGKKIAFRDTRNTTSYGFALYAKCDRGTLYIVYHPDYCDGRGPRLDSRFRIQAKYIGSITEWEQTYEHKA